MDILVHVILVMISLPVNFANAWPLDSTFNGELVEGGEWRE